jgi:hypothetical protein
MKYHDKPSPTVFCVLSFKFYNAGMTAQHKLHPSQKPKQKADTTGKHGSQGTGQLEFYCHVTSCTLSGQWIGITSAVCYKTLV